MATEVNATNLHRVQQTLGEFVTFLERHQWVVRVNTVNFFTEKMWENIVVPHFGTVAEEIAQLTETEMARLPAGQLPPQQDESTQELHAVREFIEECLCHRMEHDTGLLCRVDMVLHEIEKDEGTTSVSSGEDKTVVQPKALMNVKKSHEIEEMSCFTARLAKMHHLEKVVDIGSGKGYLGQYLTHQYGLDVIGIDSSDSNTHGARERNHKLLKKWKGQLRHSLNIQQRPVQPENPKETFKEIFTKRASKRSQMQRFVKRPATDCPTLEPLCGADDVMNMQQSHGQSEAVSELLTNQTDNEHDVQNRQLKYSSNEPVQELMNMELACSGLSSELATSAETSPPNVEQSQGMTEHLQNINVYSEGEDDDTALGQITQASTKTSNSTHFISQSRDRNTRTCSAVRGASFCSVTAFVEPTTSLSTVVSQNSEEPYQQNEIPFMLVGLHTCGDLAPSTLRLFVHDGMARVLLNVGCCYQHMSEEFETEGWNIPATKPEACGFPMSKFLRSKGTRVMRPGRMLASMAADRIATSQIIPAMGLFYRSVLQVLLQDHFRLPTRSEKVGKLAPKCRTFLEYARKALRKLKFDDSKLSDEEISAYSDRFQPYFSQLQAVNQLKVALSPTIEGLFMLDRLCYLQEQEGVHRAAVVRLFDPVTSPRCYGILATRK